MDGLESFNPGEGSPTASEGLSEEARQRFSGASQAVQQIRKEEKQAKKRDDGVAQVILQFLTDEQRTHFATLIARLVAINCPSHFILAILSLTNDHCEQAIAEYLKERGIASASGSASDETAITSFGPMEGAESVRLAMWMDRTDKVLGIDAPNILRAIVVEENNIDGTVLQLTAFVLQEFIQSFNKEAPFERVQPIAAGMLQQILGPHMHGHLERRLMEKKTEQEEA